MLLSPFGGYPADELARLRAGDRDADLYTLLCESKAPICAVLEDLRRTAQEAPLRTLLEEAEERLLLPALCAALPNGPQRQRNLAALRSSPASCAIWRACRSAACRQTAARRQGPFG